MRRFPLPALLGSTICAVLLAGCGSPITAVGPTPPPPPDPTLSFQIGGPSRIDAAGVFSWEVFALYGGSGVYQYQWDVTHLGGPQAATRIPAGVTSEPRLSLLVSENVGNMLVRLTVTSGAQVRVGTFVVRNCIDGCVAGS
jgi:hypothetical protein